MPVHQQNQYQVNVLGPISVEGPEGPVDAGATKPRLLLSLLVANAGAMVTTERLIDGLWGDDPPATARKTVHVHVSNLRRSLGAGFPLQTTRAGYLVDRDQLSIDAVRFESGVARATALLEPSPGEAADVLTGALQLWTGPAYADVADEEAIRPEALRLTELRLGAIEHRIEADLRLGRHAAVLGELETLTLDNPFRERLCELHMLALYRSGRQADALRTYERTRRTLAEELGLDPGPGLRSLHQQTLDQSSELNLVDGWSKPKTVSGRGLGAGARTVRGYELRERLGGHGNGCVYRAYQAALGREVALRLISATEANRPDFVKSFETSCQTLADLGHQHIVAILDHWRDPDGAYVVMPLLRGGTLERSIERSLWRAPAALRLLEQVGSALAYAHRRGVVHGDVTASNVLLDEDGNGYLSDFVINARGEASRLEGDRSADVAGDIERLALLACGMLTGTSPPDADFVKVRLPAGFGDVMTTATHPNPVRRFERVEDFLRALRQCFGVDSVSVLETPSKSETRNPFKGLRAFRETDAGDFFGRDDLVRELLEKVSSRGLTAVVGPSGSGKSSIVRAGLVPACRGRGLINGRDVVIAEMLPGRYPFEALESALMGVAVDRPAGLLGELGGDDHGLLRAAKRILPDDDTDLLLIVDQFEELFALTADEVVRRSFLANLCAVARDERHRVRVVVTLRADFFDRPLVYPDFGQIMKQSMTTVTLPGESSLVEAIAEPARRVGLEIEPGLIPTILRDVANQPGSLPLLQYALTEMVEVGDGNVMTIDDYRRTGGVIGALATRAEEIFESLSPTCRDVARDVFVRLVSVGDESDDTRRRVRRTELEGLGIDALTLETVIDAFGSFRLLTFDHDPVTRGPTVEVAHEALIREWPRYRAWIDERRDDLRAERRLGLAASEWLSSGRDPSFLVGGVQLERFSPWIESPPVGLTSDERSFISASRDERRARETRASTRRRRIVIGAATLSVLALIAATVAFVQRDRAENLRADAERSARRDRAEAAMAGATVQVDPDLAIRLALAEYDSLAAKGLSAPAVTSALYQATFDHKIVARLPAERDTVVEHYISVAGSADGSMFATGRMLGSYMSIVDAETGDVTATLPARPSKQVAATWDDADGLVMIGQVDGVVDVWEPDGTRVESITVSSRPVWPIWMHDGFLAVAEFASPSFAQRLKGAGLEAFDLVVHDLTTGAEIVRTRGVEKAIASPSGNRVAVLLASGELLVYDPATWSDVTPARLGDSLASAAPRDMAWAASGEELWVLSARRLARFDVATGDELAEFDFGVAAPDSSVPNTNYVAASPDGRLLAIGGYRTPIRILDASSGQLGNELVAANDNGSESMRHSVSVTWAGDRRLVVAQDDSTLLWDLGGTRAADSFWPRQAIVPVATSITPRGDRILASANGGVQVFDEAGELRFSFPAAGEPSAAALVSGDGSTLAIPDPDGVRFVDIATAKVRAVAETRLTRPLALSEDGEIAIVGTSLQPEDDQHRVEIVDTRTEEQLANLGGGIDGVRGAFTSDGRTAVIPTSNVVVAFEDQHSTLRVLDMLAGTTVGTIGVLPCVTAAAISHDDTTVGLLGCDGELALLDLATLDKGVAWTIADAVIGQVANDRTPGVGLAFEPGDEAVIVSRQDGRVEAYQADAGLTRLWSFDVGDHVGVPELHDGMVWVGASYGPGTDDVSGGMVAMPLDVEALASLARGKVTRALTTAECEQFLVEVTC